MSRRPSTGVVAWENQKDGERVVLRAFSVGPVVMIEQGQRGNAYGPHGDERYIRLSVHEAGKLLSQIASALRDAALSGVPDKLAE